MALGGTEALLLAQHLELRHLGENTQLARMTGVGPFKVCRAAQGLWFLAQLGPAFIESAESPPLAASPLCQMPMAVQGGAFLLSPVIA